MFGGFVASEVDHPLRHIVDFDKVLSDNAEYGLLEQVVRAARRRPVLVVSDGDSSASIARAFAAAAQGQEVAAPDIIDVGDCSTRSADIVIAASLTDEAGLRRRIVDELGDEGGQVLGLWSDLLVHKIAHLYGDSKPKASELFVPAVEPSTEALDRLRPYAIVCTPRTGSTFLADMLLKLGTAGTPREHLRAGPLSLAECSDFDLVRWARIVAVAGASPNGVSGTKVISHFLFRAERLHREGSFDLSSSSLRGARVLRLRRRDLVAQALSTYVANQSKVFFERNRSKRDQRDDYLRNFQYDFDAMLPSLTTLVEHEERTDDIVARTGSPVLDLYYEDIVAEPAASLRSTLDFLDIAVPKRLDAPRSSIKKLDDSKTQHIYDRFQADVQGAGHPTEHLPAAYPSPMVAANEADPPRASETPSLDGVRSLAARINPGAKMGPYQAVDIEVVDYEYSEIPGLPHRWRGPVPADLDTPGSFFTALGAAQTLGRFCVDPFVSRIADRCGLPGLNLGFSGAGPSFFLGRRPILDVVNRSKFAIVQVMSGRSEGNSFMRCDSGRNVVTWLPTGEDLFTEQAFVRLMNDYPKATVREVVAETRAAWLEHMIGLLDAIMVPTVLVWVSTRDPKYRARIDGRLGPLMSSFPHLIDHKTMRRLRRHADHHVQVISDRGLPHQLTSRHTGEPVLVRFPNGEQRSEDTSYPSPEMHDDVADALEPVIRSLL